MKKWWNLEIVNKIWNGTNDKFIGCRSYDICIKKIEGRIRKLLNKNIDVGNAIIIAIDTGEHFKPTREIEAYC